MKVSLNWLRDFIKVAPPYEKLAEDLTMAGLTVEGIEEAAGEPRDVVFEIEVTTNRPDWLSHWGVAREAAAIRNLSLKPPEIYAKARGDLPAGWSLELKDAEACPYYSGVLVEGIPASVETPTWIKTRLTLCGVRPINFVVDITNYVLLETGQPLHAFDASTLREAKIKIRRAKPGEKLLLIDGKEIELSAKDLVIADGKGPVALAGIMGGKTTEVASQTRSIFLESAYFLPSVIRASTQAHSLRSESSYRFERKVDPAGVDFARNRALWLIQEYSLPHKISVSGVLRAGELPESGKKSIKLPLEQIQKVLGISLKMSEVISILTRLGFQVSSPSSKALLIRTPSFRSDLVESVDLIEEIARVHGYDKIPETLPERSPLNAHDQTIFKLDSFLRPRIAGLGFHETVTFSLVSKTGMEKSEFENAVEIINPQNQELRWMRPSLLPSLLTVLRKNIDMKSNSTRLFEIANIYTRAPREKKASEARVLGLLLSGELRATSWCDSGRNVGYHDLKGMVLSLLSSLGVSTPEFKIIDSESFEMGVAETISLNGEMLGRLGQIKTGVSALWGIEVPVFFAQLSIEALTRAWKPIKPLVEMERYPAVIRDLSIVVPESVKVGEIQKWIEAAGQGLIRRVAVFDVFRGGRVPSLHKNLGLSITYQSSEKTLLADDVQGLHSQIADQIAKHFQATFQ